MLAVLLTITHLAFSQEQGAGWQDQVRQQIETRHLEMALAITNQRITSVPSDLEAHGWRARLLAWQRQWASAELEYRYVLERAPNDVDILAGLADVLMWQGENEEALRAIDPACARAPHETGILLRRARILRVLKDNPAAIRQYRKIVALSPGNREARDAIRELSPPRKYEMRIGAEGSTFNYVGPSESQAVAFNARWSQRLSTVLESNFDQRSGHAAARFRGSASVYPNRKTWVTLGGAVANANIIVPEHELFLECGRSFSISEGRVKGVEASFQPHWFWYQGAHVLTVSFNQLYYVGGDWTFSVRLTGARSGFAGTGVEWLPSGSSKLSFPLHRALTGNVGFANGTENFSAVDQVGHFSARTFTGGLKLEYSGNQYITGYVAFQRRSRDRTQNSFGIGYGYRF